MAWTKLHGSLIHSSIWSLPMPVRCVWITILAMADQHGMVHASVSGLARAANVSLEEARNAIACLEGPDPESRDMTSGERIRKVPGGWYVLNHANYRDKQTREQELAAERQRRHRERRGVTKRYVTPGNGDQPSCNTEAEAEAEAGKEGSKEVSARARAEADPEPEHANPACPGPVQDTTGTARDTTPEAVAEMDAALARAGIFDFAPRKRRTLASRLVQWEATTDIEWYLDGIDARTRAEKVGRLVGIFQDATAFAEYHERLCRLAHERAGGR